MIIFFSLWHFLPYLPDFWHMLLVNDDDDVGFSLVFCTTLLCFALKNIYFYFLYFCVCVRVGVCMIN